MSGKRARCWGGIDNVGGRPDGPGFSPDWRLEYGGRLGYDYDRCRRADGHDGPCLPDCGGAFTADGEYIDDWWPILEAATDLVR
jgi:hypothetical protein